MKFPVGGFLKHLVFYGDGLLCPPEGYGEAVVELLVTRRPGAVFKSYHSGEENLPLEAALRGAPALIGKAPDMVLIGLGTSDVLSGTSSDESLDRLGSLLQLVLLKTQARLVVAGLCTALIPLEFREAAKSFNEGLRRFGGERVDILDLDTPVNAFLEAHRRGGGEKRSLHAHSLRLTSTGRVFLSNTVYGLLGLDELFPA